MAGPRSKFLDAGGVEVFVGDLVLFRSHGSKEQQGEAIGIVRATVYLEKGTPLVQAEPLTWRRDGERGWRDANWAFTDAHASQFRRIAVPRDGPL